MSLMLIIFLIPAIIIIATLLIAALSRKRRSENAKSIAFFHPYANAGGGGERVLWCAVKGLMDRYPDYQIVIYTGDTEVSPSEILKTAKQRFNISVKNDNHLKFIFLQSRRLLEADLYPVVTLLGQAIGGLLVGIEAFYRFVPHIFVDTMGCPLSMPLFSLIGGCKILCYVHYPVISTDMISLVQNRTESYNNRAVISRNPVLSKLKLAYYQMFAVMYSLAGRTSDIALVNGTWTKNHIIQLWQRPDSTRIVYPPIDTDNFKIIQNSSEQLLIGQNEIRIVSIGQFRPEKNHQLQIEALKLLLDKLREHDDWSNITVKLVLIGGCRNDGDRQRVDQLSNQAKDLGISDNVEIMVNLPFNDMLNELSRSMIGVVETMAAGTIMLAHNSAGPKLDIVVPANDGPSTVGQSNIGYLAWTAEEYSDRLWDIINLDVIERDRIRKEARLYVTGRFGDAIFERQFLEACQSLMDD